MTDRRFLDTNILLYADDLDAGPKQEVAIRLIEESITEGTGVVSTQVFQEYFVNATNKLGIAPEVVRRKIELMSSMEVVRIRLDDVLDAIDLYRLHQLSFWDALIVSCASSSGCTTVLTEDLQDSQVVAGVKIENPFK